jgi:large subunit ribosomal protein L35
MPKMKTHSGAKKRFKVTSNGKIRRRQAFMNHMLEKKPSTRTRKLNRPALVAKGEQKTVTKTPGP